MTQRTDTQRAIGRAAPVIPTRYRGLIALNVAALGILCLITFAGSAAAQPSRERVAGEYTMVTGELQARTEDAIYIIDARNREMLALMWDRSQRSLEPIGAGYRNFDADARANERRGR